MTYPTLHHSSAIAEQFRVLANWIDRNGTTPWHIEFDWGSNQLVAHLDRTIYLELFPSATPTIDSIGITWRALHNGIIFQSFSTHQPKNKKVPDNTPENLQHPNLRDSA